MSELGLKKNSFDIETRSLFESLSLFLIHIKASVASCIEGSEKQLLFVATIGILFSFAKDKKKFSIFFSSSKPDLVNSI